METKITRRELYNLVWSTPMTKLAAGYGISDVALRKKCVKHDIPTPGLGYWAKVAAGHRVPRIPFPKKSTARDEISLQPILPTAVHEGETPPPIVEVPTRLTNPHEAVAFLRDRLEGSRTDKFDRLTGGHDWRHCIRQRNLPRLLRLLQGLFVTLESRGHEIKVVATSPHTSERDVQLVVGGHALNLSFEERLRKKERPLTKQEQDEFKSRSEWNVRFGQPPPKETKRWVQYPDDDLVLRTRGHWQYSGPQGWADSKHHKLEEMLGEVILGLEAIARFDLEKEAEARREAEERLTKERARLREGRLKEYWQLLAEDLGKMAATWAKSKHLLEFLTACDGKLPSTPEAEEWLDAAKRYAEKLDPFFNAETIPKSLSPTDEELERILSSKR